MIILNQRKIYMLKKLYIDCISEVPEKKYDIPSSRGNHIIPAILYLRVDCDRKTTFSQLKVDFPLRANVLKVDIFFEEFNYEVISEEPSYEASYIFVDRS